MVYVQINIDPEIKEFLETLKNKKKRSWNVFFIEEVIPKLK